MLVKICGITKQVDGLAVAESGADMIGFVFAKSKRQVTAEQAKKIGDALPETVKKVGVFVNESIVEIERIVTEAGLDYVQLHGQESPAFCAQLSVPVIKAFQIKQQQDLARVADYQCAYYLLDSPAGPYQGGNGETFDWSLINHMPNLRGKIILAGGLNPANVQAAIKSVGPLGVDVSSGVETAGQKDQQKITTFIKQAKEG